MKRLFSFVLILALCLSLAPLALAEDAVVVPSPQKFTLDGKTIDLPAYNIGGYNYVMLRALAGSLALSDSRFNVRYDEATKTVVVATGESYATTEESNPIGSVSLDEQGCVVGAVRSKQSVVIDGKECSFDAWNIGGNNYFRLAELQSYLGYRLSYDQASNTAQIGSAQTLDRPETKIAESYQDVQKALKASGVWYGKGDVEVVEEAEADAVEAPAAVAGGAGTETTTARNTAADNAEGGADEDIGTNVQVAGVDEGDIVKTDGQYIYVLNGSYQLTVLKAEGADTRVVSNTDVGYSESEDGDNRWSSKWKSPAEMYVADGRLAVLSTFNSYLRYEDAEGKWHWEDENRFCVDIYDVSDPSAPKPLSELGQDGWLLSSRLSEGKLYVITNRWVYSYDEEEPETYIPILYRDGVKTAMAAERICICGEGGSEYVIVGVYDLAGASLTDSMSLLGSGDEIYMTKDSLYVLGSVWEKQETTKYTESIYEVTAIRQGRNTQVFRFDLSGALTLAASAKVPGYVDDQFSADEYQGNLRLVTTRSENRYRIYEDKNYGFVNYQWEDTEQSSGLYVLDADLNLLGAVTDLAQGERVYSARFDGEIGYFTTFRNVDPLFTVDLSDPSNPTVLHALKISGFSQYLHNWGAGRLFGFGREADEESGWAEELKLVMFNTEDKTDVYAEQTLKLDADYSEALYDHKAFFISAERNVIGFVGDNDYYVFSYDPQAGFTQLAKFDLDYDWSVRGIAIGNTAYIVSPNQVTVLDMNDWTVLVKVQIGEAEKNEVIAF